MRQFDRDVPQFIDDLVRTPEIFLEMPHIAPIWVDQLEELRDLFINSHKTLSNLVILSELSENYSNLLIIGDIHGDFYSLYRIVQPFFDGKVDTLLFLGDYVDRGDNNLLTIIFLLSMVVTWPDRIILLRGNHEDLEINHFFGFYQELQTFYPFYSEFEKVIEIFNEIYDYMSLIAVTPQNSVCMHAGLPKNFTQMKIFHDIPKPHSLIEGNLTSENLEQSNQFLDAFFQVRWNDPTEKPLNNANEKSYHGYYYYSFEEVKIFLNRNKKMRIIKSHEPHRGGFQDLFKHHLLHIFSNEPYRGEITIAFTIHEKPDGTTILRDLDFNNVLEIPKPENF